MPATQLPHDAGNEHFKEINQVGDLTSLVCNLYFIN